MNKVKMIKSISIHMNIDNVHSTGSIGVVLCVIMLSDKRIALGGDHGRLSICSINISSKKWKVDIFKDNTHSKDIKSLCQLSQTRIASCSDDCLIKVWALSHSNIKLIKKITYHTSYINHLLILCDYNNNEHFVSCSSDNTCVIINSNSYKAVSVLHDKGKVYAALQLKQRDILVTSVYPPLLSFWNLSTYQHVTAFCGYYASFASHIVELPNGNVALSSDTNGCPIVVVDTERYVVVKEIVFDWGDVSISSLAVLNENSFIYVYQGRVVQVSCLDYSVMVSKEVEGGLSGLFGVVCVGNGKYGVVMNNSDGVVVVKMVYE